MNVLATKRYVVESLILLYIKHVNSESSCQTLLSRRYTHKPIGFRFESQSLHEAELKNDQLLRCNLTLHHYQLSQSNVTHTHCQNELHTCCQNEFGLIDIALVFRCWKFDHILCQEGKFERTFKIITKTLETKLYILKL